MSNISTLYFSDKNKHSTLAQKVKWVMDIRGDALDKEGHDITCHGWPVTLAEHTGANSVEPFLIQWELKDHDNKQ